MSPLFRLDQRLHLPLPTTLEPLALAISLIFLGTAHTAAHADAGITDLGTLATDNAGRSTAYGINAVGDSVIGETRSAYGQSHAFLWTRATGMIDLGTMANDMTSGPSAAYGINAAGDVVVGTAQGGVYSDRAFRWTEATGMIDLGTLRKDNTLFSTARGVNEAGDVVVGWADTDSGTTHAFRWTLNAGSTTVGTMTDLGTLAANKTDGMSVAYGVNRDGNVVVGDATTNSGDNHAFRWTLNAGSTTQGTMSDLGTLRSDNTGNSYAYGVNRDGNVVVGYAANNNDDTHAVRWTFNNGSTTPSTKTDLGTLATDNAGVSVAHGINAAGNVVVGDAFDGETHRAFRWTLNSGSTTEGTMQSIEAWLADNGVKVKDSIQTRAAYGVNAAGDVVVGQLDNKHAFIATTKGLLDQVENNKSLAGSSGTPARAMQDASLVMHGAHGSPMRGLLTAGKQSLWTAGDVGHGDNQGNDGNLGAGEVGYARGISDQVMVKFALGRTTSKQDTAFGGNTRVDGTYIMPEVIAKVSDMPLYASFSGYYNWGDADIKRGYDNAGTREYGRGSADTSTAAVRARLDWLDAVKYGKTAFTPYTSVTYAHTKVDSYSETGGAFPASWNSRSEHSSEARLGLDAVHHVDDKLNLLGRLEGVHRFNDTGATASGDVAGLYGFSLPGQTYKQNWLRAAVGLEGKMGAGTGSLMLNGSTQSDAAKYWLAASYRMDF